jgi:DNA-directed RNA polymerase II subunit RPB1
MPEKCMAILKGISAKDLTTLGFDKTTSHPAWMIIKNLPVAPPPVRPSVVEGSIKSEDDLTYAYI